MKNPLALALLALACGAAPEDPVDEDESSDLGRLTEAFSDPSGLGSQKDSNGIGGVACVFPNTSGNPCKVPTDKIVNFHWSGASTDPTLPGVDMIQAMNDAAGWLNFIASGSGWTITTTTGSSNELMHFAPTAIQTDLAETSFGSVSAFTFGGNFYAKYNHCTTNVSAAHFVAGGYDHAPGISAQDEMTFLLMHEMGHCVGVYHVFNTCSANGAFMHAPICKFAPLNWEIATTQFNALKNYAP